MLIYKKNSTSIASQVKYVASVDIDMALLALANTSNAYVLKSSRAQWSLSIVDYVTRNEGSLFRIMKDRLSINALLIHTFITIID